MNVRAVWKRLFGAPAPTSRCRQTGSRDPMAEAFRLAFEHAPIAMAFVGPDLRFRTVNAALCRLVGYTEAELRSLTVVDLTHPEDVAKSVESTERLVRGDVPSFTLEKRYRTRSGATVWGEVTMTLVRDQDGAVLYGLVMIENISKRKGMEQAVRSALEFRRRIMEATTSAIAALDADGRFILANRGAAEISGYRVEELIGRSFRTLLPDAELARVGAQVEGTLTRGVPVSQFETVLLRRDGATRVISFSLQPLVLEDGQSGLVGTAEDITERKRAEEVLRNSEDRYRDLVEHSKLLIGTHDLDGKVLSINRSAVEFMGYERAEELLGTRFTHLLAPAARQLFPAYLKQIRDHGHTRGLMKIVTRRGEEKVLEYDNSMRQEGLAAPIVRCFAYDVTERWRAAKAVKASEARYRALYEDNPAMYFTVDAAGIILSVNPFGAEQLGYTVAELVGQPVLRVFHDEDREAVWQQVAACLQRPAAVANWEFRKVRRDGSVLWVREAARAVQNAEGRTVVLIVCEDITDRKRTEEALRESEARLRRLGDNLPNGIVFQVVRDADGGVSLPYISAGIEQLVGVTAEEAVRDARALYDLIVEEDRPSWQAVAAESLRSLSTLDLDVRMRTRAGPIKWTHLWSAPRRLPDGGTLWDAIQVDVTHARRNLEALLQTVRAIVWEGEEDVTAQTYRTTFVSQQAERLLGYPVKDWLDQPTFWLDHLHPEDRQRVASLRREAIAARSGFELDYRMLGSDGRTVWLRGIVNVVAADERHVKLGGVMVDITEPKRAEAALRESEERFRTLADIMPASVFIYRGDRYVYVNPAAELMTGYTRDELLAMKIWELVHPTSRKFARGRAEARQRGDRIPSRHELRLLSKAGQDRWVETMAIQVMFQGQPSVLVTGFDITERKRAEAALRESQQALWQSHQRIRDLAGKLIIAQEAERKRISRELHDDVSQRLAALAIAISALRQNLSRSTDVVSEQLTALRNRVIALSDDVRRLSHQLHPAALEHIGLEAALKSCCAEFGSHEGIEVTLTIGDGIEAIPPDMALCLYRITQESLHNIARHADTRDARVTLAATGEGIHLSIADTGIGFEPGQVKQKGGLGLISMEERVRLLRGSFQIASHPGRGTELRVHLPVSRAPA